MRDRFRLAALADSVQPVGRLIGACLAQALMPTLAGFLERLALAEVLTLLATWALAAQTGDVGPMLAAVARCAKCALKIRMLRILASTNGQSTGAGRPAGPAPAGGRVCGPAAAGAFRLAAQLANALSKLSILVTRAAFPEIVRTIRSASRAIRMGVLRWGWPDRGGGRGDRGGRAVRASLLMLVGGHAGAGYIYLLWLAGAGAIELAAASFEPILLWIHRALFRQPWRAGGGGPATGAHAGPAAAHRGAGGQHQCLVGAVAASLTLVRCSGTMPCAMASTQAPV
jgi:hypothetical protein